MKVHCIYKRYSFIKAEACSAKGVLVSAHQNSIYPVPATQSLVSAAALLNTPLNLLKVSSKTNDSNRNHAL